MKSLLKLLQFKPRILWALLAFGISTVFFFQNCAPTRYESSNLDTKIFASEEDQIWSMLNSANDMASKLDAIDMNSLVINIDKKLMASDKVYSDKVQKFAGNWNTGLELQATDVKLKRLSSDLRVKSNEIQNMIKKGEATNSGIMLKEMDMLVSMMASAEVQMEAFERKKGDYLLAVHFTDITNLIKQNLVDYQGISDTRFQNLEKQLDALVKKHDALESAYTQFSTKTYPADQQAQKEALAKSLDLLKKDLEDKIESAKQDAIAFANDLNKKLDERLSQRLDEQGKKISDLDTKLDKKISELSTKLDNLDSKLVSTVDQYNKALEALKTATAAQKTDLEAQIAGLKKELTEADLALAAQLKADIASVRSGLEAEVKIRTEQNAQMQTKLAEVQAKINDTANQVSEEFKKALKKMNDDLTRDITANLQQIDAQKKALEELKAGVNGLKNVIEVQNAKTEQEKKDAEEAQKKLAELRAKMCGYKADGTIDRTTNPNCITVEAINCAALFPAADSRNQCTILVDVVKFHDRQLEMLRRADAEHDALIAAITKDLQILAGDVSVLNQALINLHQKVLDLGKDLLVRISQTESEMNASISQRLDQLGGKVDELSGRVDSVVGDVEDLQASQEALKKEVEAQVKGLTDRMAEAEARLDAHDESFAQVFERLGVLEFQKARSEAVSAMTSRAEANLGWISRRTVDIKDQFCHKRRVAALNKFDYKAARHAWAFCNEKLRILTFAQELNKIALSYAASLGSVNIDTKCNAIVKDSSGAEVNVNNISAKAFMQDKALFAAVEKACPEGGIPVAKGRMVTVVNFLKQIGPDHRTFNYMKSQANIAGILFLGDEVKNLTEASALVKSFEDVDPTSAANKDTLYGQIERLFVKRYFDSVYKPNNQFVVDPNKIKFPSDLGLAYTRSQIDGRLVADLTLGKEYINRVAELETSPSLTGFEVVARNVVSSGQGKRFAYPIDARENLCPVDDDLIVNHKGKFYAYHVSYNDIWEEFAPVLVDGNHLLVASTEADAKAGNFNTRTAIRVERAGLTTAAIPKRWVLRATQPYGNAYGRPNCVKFTMTPMLKDGEWRKPASIATKVEEEKVLHRYLTGFTQSTVKYLCNQQSYDLLQEVKKNVQVVKVVADPNHQGSTKLEPQYNADGSPKMEVQKTLSIVQTRLVASIEELMTLPASEQAPFEQQGIRISLRNASEITGELSRAYVGTSVGATANAINDGSTQLSSQYWMWNDRNIDYTAQNVSYGKTSPFFLAPTNTTWSSTQFVRESVATAPVSVQECEHCKTNLAILGSCDKVISRISQ